MHTSDTGTIDISREVRGSFGPLILALALLAMMASVLFFSDNIYARIRPESAAEFATKRYVLSLFDRVWQQPMDAPMSPESLNTIYEVCVRGKEQADMIRPHVSQPYGKALDLMVSGCASLGVRQGKPPVRVEDVRAVMDAVDAAMQEADEILKGPARRKAQEERERELAKAPERVRSMATWK